MNADVQKIMSDYRTLLDRTIRAENEAYSTQQYDRKTINMALGQVLEHAKAAIKVELGLTNGRKIKVASNAGKMAYNKTKLSADLHLFCKGGKVQKLAHLLEEVDGLGLDHFDINCKNSNRCTALHQTIIAGHADVVRILIANKADVSLKSAAAGIPPLHEAAKRNNIDIVKILIEHGADRSQTSNNEQTVFDFPINLETWSVLENTPGPAREDEPAGTRTTTSTRTPADQDAQAAQGIADVEAMRSKRRYVEKDAVFVEQRRYTCAHHPVSHLCPFPHVFLSLCHGALPCAVARRNMGNLPLLS